MIAGVDERPETAEARGLYVVRLHQAVEDWRERRRQAHAASWPPLAMAMIDMELAAIEREIAEMVRRLF